MSAPPATRGKYALHFRPRATLTVVLRTSVFQPTDSVAARRPPLWIQSLRLRCRRRTIKSVPAASTKINSTSAVMLIVGTSITTGAAGV